MIILKEIDLRFGEQIVFNKISGTIDKSNRIGLVGRNGSGKSTLLKAIAGLQEIDSGECSIQKNAKIGYLPQEVVLQSDRSIYDETFSVFKEIDILLQKLAIAEKTLSCDKSIEEYASIQHELSEFNVSAAQVETKKVLAGLGFSSLDTPVSSLSVGWKMRVVLAKLLLQKADFYLFDEPTNHLDIVASDWFLKFLQTSTFGFLLVCHDRYFLDHACNKIFELELGNLNLYHGNYSFYRTEKERRTETIEASAERQKKEIAKKIKTIERFRASASKAKMAQSMIKKIEKIEPIQTVQKSKTIAVPMPKVERSGKIVLKVENVSHKFGEKIVFQNASFEIDRGEKVALVAPNGVGKSTLLSLIAKKISLQEGDIIDGYHTQIAMFEQDQDKVLTKENTILDEIESACKNSDTRAMVRSLLGAFLFSGDSVYKKIKVLSGGEKNRVAMVKVLLQQANVLILDEPTNHLDIESREILLDVLKKFEGTLLFVSHDRDFLDRLATRIIELTQKRTISYPGNYESYIYHRDRAEKSIAEETQVKNKPVNQQKDDSEQRKKISRLEKKIDDLEQKIQGLNNKLSEMNYGTEEFSATYDKIVSLQQALNNSLKEWESLSEETN